MALIPEVYGLPLAGKFTAVAWEPGTVQAGEQRDIKNSIRDRLVRRVSARTWFHKIQAFTT